MSVEICRTRRLRGNGHGLGARPGIDIAGLGGGPENESGRVGELDNIV
jgi:hypothetical protein